MKYQFLITGMTNNVQQEYYTIQYCNCDWMFHQDTGSTTQQIIEGTASPDDYGPVDLNTV